MTGSNNYWVATNDQGIIKFSLNKENDIKTIEHYKSEATNFSLANTTVFSFYEDNAGIVWIGTAKGISKYIPSKARFSEAGFFSKSFFQNQFVNALLYDNKDRLWIGRDSDTLTVINNTESYLLPLSSARNQFNQVNMLYQSKPGDIYIATFTSGLFIIPNSLNNIHDTRQWIHITILIHRCQAIIFMQLQKIKKELSGWALIQAYAVTIRIQKK